MSVFKFTAAVIGTGYIGVQHIDALKNIVSDIVICNTDVESGKKASEKYGCRFYSDVNEMLDNEKVDFACICVPTPIHCKLAGILLERGVNVLCEKPFATNCKEANDVVNMAKEKNVPFSSWLLAYFRKILSFPVSFFS